MKKVSFMAAIAVLVLSIALIQSCKKKEQELDAKTKQFNDDSNDVKGESDASDNDVTDALQEYTSFGRSAGVRSSPLCGVSIDTSQIAQKIIYLNFDGITPCFSPSRTRGGQVKVQLIVGNHWADAGAKLGITYINFKVVRLSDNKSITFNGYKTLKNVSGHNILGFLAGTATYEHQSRAYNVDLLFNDGTHATWNAAYTTKWGYTPSNTRITFTADGDTTLNGFTHVSAWGVNRNSLNFTTNYNSPIVSNTYCGLWRFVGGELVHHVSTNSFTLTLGVDQSGNASTLDCAYGYKVSWTVNGNSSSTVMSY